MKGKIFSLDDANSTLPLVRRIVVDVKACTKLVERFERYRDIEVDDAGLRAEYTDKLGRLAVRLRECGEELSALGCFLEDARTGTVKFYGERDGRIVYFAWRLGEPRVSSWYPLEKSFLDRRPLDDGGRVRENAQGL